MHHKHSNTADKNHYVWYVEANETTNKRRSSTTEKEIVLICQVNGKVTKEANQPSQDPYNNNNNLDLENRANVKDTKHTKRKKTQYSSILRGSQ